MAAPPGTGPVAGARWDDLQREGSIGDGRPATRNGAPQSPAAESHAAAKLLDLDVHYPTRHRQTSLRRALKDARRRKDASSVALLVAWLSDEAAV